MLRCCLLPAVLLAFTAVSTEAEDEVRFDFESGDLQVWRIVEGKFDRLVSDRDAYHNAYPEQPDRKYNKQGKFYLSTVEQQRGMPSNDRMTGTVESPVFVLAGPDMSLLVGSGTQAGTYVALCALDGQEVLVARGKAETEIMQRVAWHAPELVGKPVFLRAVDRETGGWGHVTCDDFTATGTRDPTASEQRWAELEARVVRQRLDEVLKQSVLESLRAAIDDLTATFATDRLSGQRGRTRGRERRRNDPFGNA